MKFIKKDFRSCTVLAFLLFSITLSLRTQIFSRTNRKIQEKTVRSSLFYQVSRDLSNHLPYGVLIPQEFATIPCENPITFVYDYGSGGYGDCIKGIVAVAEIAYLIGCPFAIDLSKHPFQRILPISKDLVSFNQGNEKSSMNILDWSTGEAAIHRLNARNHLFWQLANETYRIRESSLRIYANVPQSRELARALHLEEAHVISLGRLLLESFYSHIVVSSRLGSFWPKPSEAFFRVGIHIRMGGMYIKDASIKTDVRIHDINELKRAVKVINERAKMLAGDKSIIIFVCADTTEARKLVREVLSPLHIIEPPTNPVHIGYEKSFESSTRDEETLSVVREHLTLSTASAIFVGSKSGFSMTACALAAVNAVNCFIRNGDEWVTINPGDGVYT